MIRFLMPRTDFVWTAIPKELDAEIKRVLIDCEKLGIFLNKKNAGKLVTEKSKRGSMTAAEIKDYIRTIRGIVK